LGCFLARQYRDTRLTVLEKRNVFRHNFSWKQPWCTGFFREPENGAKGTPDKTPNKKAGLKAGLSQFGVESAQ
jgi:hypothetical protein